MPSGKPLYQEVNNDHFIVMESEVKVTQWSPTPCDTMDYTGQNTGVGSHSLLQGSSQPRDGTHVSHIAGGYQPSHQGSIRILECIA